VAAPLNPNPFGVRGGVSVILFWFGCGESGFLKARCAISVVPVLVVPRVVRAPVVLEAGCAGVIPRLVVRIAGSGQRDRVLGVVPIDARYAGRDRVLGVVPCKACCAGRDPFLVWSAHAGGERGKATGTPNTPMQPTASRARSEGF